MIQIEILAKICKRGPSIGNAFRLSQILFLMENIRSKGVEVNFKNKSMLQLEISNRMLSVNVNALDGEYYVLNSEGELVKILSSIQKLHEWIYEIIDDPSLLDNEEDLT